MNEYSEGLFLFIDEAESQIILENHHDYLSVVNIGDRKHRTDERFSDRLTKKREYNRKYREKKRAEKTEAKAQTESGI